ncbi:superoxide dismutase family protein [Pseudalkalibacillus sp. A8]|uniref:superoxide dismutase family protein n=1 Tax=Pseudalkalibacillus sp. A8 TaxID=3382641 RepID=UPI0038B5498C
MKKIMLSIFASLLAVASLTACGVQENGKDSNATQPGAVEVNSSKVKSEDSRLFKMVDIYNSKKEKIGQAQLAESDEGVMIKLKAAKLPPGPHAFHIHEIGKCVAPDFKSAGEHYNPTGKEHGFENPKGFHAGDLPNINIRKDGTVSVSVVSKNVTLRKGKPHTLLDEDGSALVIHEKADDYKTDPAGNAGDRIACGEIK